MPRPSVRTRILAGVLAYMFAISAFDLITIAPASAVSLPSAVVSNG